MSNGFQNIDKQCFAKLYSKLWNSNKAFKRAHPVAGFEASGIYPFNPSAIPAKKFQISKNFMQPRVVSPSSNVVAAARTSFVSPSSNVEENDVVMSDDGGYDSEVTAMDFTESNDETDYSTDTLDSGLSDEEECHGPASKRTRVAIANTQYKPNNDIGALSQAVQTFFKDSIQNRIAKPGKRTRITRPLAECVTDTEALARMEAKQAEAEKKKELAALKKEAAKQKREAARAKAIERNPNEKKPEKEPK